MPDFQPRGQRLPLVQETPADLQEALQVPAAELDRQEARLRAVARELRAGGVAVALSGGVDSALLLAVLHDELGPEPCLAVTACSHSFPEEERLAARQLAQSLGARHEEVQTLEMEREGYRENSLDRCWFCKDELFTELRKVADRNQLRHIAYGANLDDTGDHRPGMRAASQWGVRAPLLEAEMSKAHVRALARRLGLTAWDKPAYACLSSRIPHGESISSAKLRQVDQAERVLRDLGFRQFRVRHHDSVARIEVASEELSRAFDPAIRPLLVERLKSAGYRFVSLDLEGYRSGRMHEGLASPTTSER